MSGYLGFNLTSSESINEILNAVETAGDGYHHTEMWDEPLEYREDGKSYSDLIQDAATKAAQDIQRLTQALAEKDDELKDSEALLTELQADIDDLQKKLKGSLDGRHISGLYKEIKQLKEALREIVEVMDNCKLVIPLSVAASIEKHRELVGDSE